MSHYLYLAWCYIVRHRFRSGVLILSIAAPFYLPITVTSLVEMFESSLRQRASNTPVIIGGQGSEFDLVFHSLYFRGVPAVALNYEDFQDAKGAGFGKIIPLYLRFSARKAPIVGTSIDYFATRELKLSAGRNFALLGECVIGHHVAQRLELRVGDRLISDNENVFDLAAEYPLRMKIVGILEESLSPDDDGVFVDVKTAWVIAGIGHGHQDLTLAEEGEVLEVEGANIKASAALLRYNEITRENISSFHFHGENLELPLTSLLFFPDDDKSRTLLLGRYGAQNELLQALIPADVIEELFGIVFQIKRFFDLNVILVAVSTTLFLVLVVVLSLQLRTNERRTLHRMGCNRWAIVWIQSLELALVLGCGVVLASVASIVTLQMGDHFLSRLL